MLQPRSEHEGLRGKCGVLRIANFFMAATLGDFLLYVTPKRVSCLTYNGADEGFYSWNSNQIETAL